MDFELSDDERSLAEAMRKLCAGRFPMDGLRAAEGRREVDRAGWQELAAAGVFGLTVAEDEGGLGLGRAHGAVVFEELGRALVPGPLADTYAAAPLVTGASGGEVVVGVVRPSQWERLPLVVADLGSLDALLVVDDTGVEVADPSHVQARPLDRPLDPLTPMWAVELTTARAVGGPDDAKSLWTDLLVARAAYLVGIAAACTDMAVEYAKSRQQFGRAIGSFQAVKHMCADMLVRTETARSAVHAAAVTIDQPDVGDAARAAAGAALLAGEAAVSNGKACIQVHGGMGFTWEVPAHLYLMRARVLSDCCGPASALAETVAESF